MGPGPLRACVLASLCLWCAACNGALPPIEGPSGGVSSAASGGSGPASGPGTSSSGSATGGTAIGTASNSGSSSAGASTGQPASTGSSGSTGGIGVSATGAATSSGSGGKPTGTGGSTTGGAGDGGAECQPACKNTLTCCDGQCVDLTADTFNCGVCGKLCPAGDYCEASNCVPTTCPPQGCMGGTSCCEFQCCGADQVCCLYNGTVTTFKCEDSDAGACELGCGGMCISRRDAKRDIQYLDEAQLQSAEEQVLKIPLAHFNYKWDAPSERRRLGFIIEDVAPNPGVIDAARGEVDLYGYTSLAVAALQEQAREIERLRQQVGELEKRLDDVASAPRPKRPPKR